MHRRGFERGLTGPRVLVPRGISTASHRLRASCIEDLLTFEHIFLAVSAPDRDAHRAKLLTALLNSKLLYWFAFHGTASFGPDRPEIQQAELLRLPFPAPQDFQHDGRSSDAASELVSLIDDAMASARESFALGASDDGLLDEFDSHCYRYFGLGEEEIALVEDSVASVIPGVQPHNGASRQLDIGRAVVYNLGTGDFRRFVGGEATAQSRGSLVEGERGRRDGIATRVLPTVHSAGSIPMRTTVHELRHCDHGHTRVDT